MPDKHEVGGSTPLEPTTVNEVDCQTFASESQQPEAEAQKAGSENSEARERIRKPERKKDAGKTDMWVW